MARLQLALLVTMSSTPDRAGQTSLASWNLVWSQVNRNIFLRSPWRPAPISGPIKFRRNTLLFSTFVYFCLLLTTFCPIVSSACLAASLPFGLFVPGPIRCLFSLEIRLQMGLGKRSADCEIGDCKIGLALIDSLLNSRSVLRAFPSKLRT